MKRNENYKADLLEDLRNDPEYAAEYLTAARADSKEAFLVALRDVAEARKGMKKVAKEANVNRENLYRALSRQGNPRVETVDSVLDVLGMGVRIFAKAVSTVAGNSPATTTPALVTTTTTVNLDVTEQWQADSSPFTALMITGTSGYINGTTTTAKAEHFQPASGTGILAPAPIWSTNADRPTEQYARI